MTPREQLKPLRTPQDHSCFACGPLNPHGLQMTFFTDENAVFSWVRVQEYLRGWDNLVHGGVVSAILDEIMSWTAIYLIKKVTLTKSMTVEFLKPIIVCSELRAEGRLIEHVGERDARLEGFIYNSKGTLCARSTGLFVMLNPKIAKRLGVMGDRAIRDFEHIIEL